MIEMNHQELEALRLLRERGESTGLDLVRASEASGGKLKRGAVYFHLMNLDAASLVTSREEDSPPPDIGIPRRIYRITDAGVHALLGHEAK